MRIYMKARYERRRAAAVEQLGGKCVDCNTVDGLEFDHVDSTTKSHSLAKILAGGSEAKVQAELAKCVLRCRPCHEDKSRLAGDWNRWESKMCCGNEFHTKQAYAAHRRWHHRASLV